MVDGMLKGELIVLKRVLNERLRKALHHIQVCVDAGVVTAL